jgi:thymidylate kinase
MRVVFEFLSETSGKRSHWARLLEWLRQEGAALLNEPTGSPPHTLVAVLRADADPQAFVAQLRKLPGVGRADIEQLRFSL